MGFRFRKSIKILPGVRVNVSRTGVSTTIGPRGATVSVGKRGVHVNAGLPGTGLSYRQRLDVRTQAAPTREAEPAREEWRPLTADERRIRRVVWKWVGGIGVFIGFLIFLGWLGS